MSVDSREDQSMLFSVVRNLRVKTFVLMALTTQSGLTQTYAPRPVPSGFLPMRSNSALGAFRLQATQVRRGVAGTHHSFPPAFAAAPSSICDSLRMSIFHPV